MSATQNAHRLAGIETRIPSSTLDETRCLILNVTDLGLFKNSFFLKRKRKNRQAHLQVLGKASGLVLILV